MKSRWLAAVLALPATAHAAGTLVQIAQSPLVTGDSIVMPYPSPNQAGDVSVVAVTYRGDCAPDLVSVQDSSNSYTLIGADETGATSSDAALSVYYAEDIAAGANTVTATLASNCATVPDSAMIIAELGGIVFNPPDENTFGVSTVASFTVTSGSAPITAFPGEYVLGVACVANGGVSGWIPEAGATLEISDPRLAYEDMTVSTSGTYAASFSISPALASVAAVVTWQLVAQDAGASDAGADAGAPVTDAGNDGGTDGGRSDGGVGAPPRLTVACSQAEGLVPWLALASLAFARALRFSWRRPG